MKNEIKVGDCFKEKANTHTVYIVVGIDDDGTFPVRTIGTNMQRLEWIRNPGVLLVARAEFDAALDARFAAIKAELPEVN